MNILFILALFLLVSSSQAAKSCSASVSLTRRLGNDWTEEGKMYTIYDVAVMNTGDCATNLIHINFNLAPDSQITRGWNINALGNGVWELSNFGEQLQASSTFSGAGFTLQYASQATVSASISNIECLSCSPSNEPSTAPPTTPPSTPRSPISDELLVRLINAGNENEREDLLKDEEFVFDFKNSLLGETQSVGGRTVATSRRNFPAVIGHNIAMTVGFIEPCGINLPHTHPRATEINFIASGRFQAGMFQENGARFIGNILEAGMATVFPQGAIHFEINLECEPAVFVAAFNNEDPGVQTTASSFFGLPVDVAAVSLNITNIKTVEDLAKFLPENPGVAMQACMERCGFSSSSSK